VKKELLEINEMVRGDEIAEKIMSDLLDVYYKRERIGKFRKKLIHFSKPLLIIIAEALFLLTGLVLAFNVDKRLDLYSLNPIVFPIVLPFGFLMIFYLELKLSYMLEDVNDKINEKYLYKIKDGELDYINDILYEQKEFKKKYEIIKKGSNRYIDYPPLTKIRKKTKYNELEIYSYYQINKISFDKIDIDCWECKIWK
jgi:hypothetical protein